MPTPRDAALAAHAVQRHGVASTAELRRIGLDAAAVGRRVRRGWLHPVHRGVVAVGHPRLTPQGRWLAAVLACGAGAVLSHRSAAALWGFRPTARARIEVTIPATKRRGPLSVEVRTTRSLAAADVTVVDGIPVTTVARTLCDLAGVLPGKGLARAVHEAQVAGLLDVGATRAAVARLNGRRGLARLAALLDRPAAPTRSEFERRFLDVLDEEGLPRPEVGVPVAGHTVDFLFREARLVVETDGKVHLADQKFETDRTRDADLLVAGYSTLRVTWRRLTRERAQLTEQLRTLTRGRSG